MSDVRFSQAASAYNDALRAAERIIQQSGSESGGMEEANATRGAGFLDMVGSALKSAETTGYKSEDVSNRAVTGKAGMSEVITAIASAEEALQTVVAVRDKVINAYQEIIRMPV